MQKSLIITIMQKRVQMHKLISFLTFLGHTSSGFILVLVKVLYGFLSLWWKYINCVGYDFFYFLYPLLFCCRPTFLLVTIVEFIVAGFQLQTILYFLMPVLLSAPPCFFSSLCCCTRSVFFCIRLSINVSF